MKKAISVAVASVLFGSAAVSAQVPEAEWEQFKAQFAAMSERMNTLEAENQELRNLAGVQAGVELVTVEDLAATNAEVATLKSQNKSTSWAENMKWQGDFRYRYEEIDEDGKDDRDRNRIRARAALIAKTSDTTEVGLGLASGGDDPVSTNQTLGGGGSTKDVRLDLGYLKWTGLENTYITAGKFKNPYYTVQKSSLIWDGDFRPEGLAASWQGDTFFATAEYSFIESDSKNEDDGIWGAQVGAQFSLFDNMRLTAAAKYLDIPTKDREAIYDDSFFGNSSVNNGGVDVYEYDYKLINASIELALNLFDMPVSLYGDYVENDDADDLETGYLAGVKLGKAKSKGSWQLQYQYEDLEADATLGLVTDSDFMGGGTDGKGHKLSGKYALAKKWTIGATYFDGSRGVDQGKDADYQRLMLDTVFKY
ncbi:MAG: putative porin [Halioglobus sp.]